jgi:two-component system, NarL family, response regulator NreC
MSIRVLIADDHPLVRDGLRFSIERSDKEIEVVGEASDGEEALKLVASRPVDVVIMDITMPRVNGLDATRELIRRNPGTKVVILSLHATSGFVEQAFEIGARGYLTKESASRNVVEAIHQVAAGRVYLSPDIAHVLVERRRSTKTRPKKDSRVASLTAQERRVLQLIAEGWTAKQIASALNIAFNTVRVHKRNLMSKTGLHKQTELVRFAVKEGLAKL